MLWNDGVEMAEFGMTRVRIGLFQYALAHPEANSERFESIEAKLDELRSYLGSGANFIKCMYLSGERLCRFKRPGPRSKFPERWLLFRLVV